MTCLQMPLHHHTNHVPLITMSHLLPQRLSLSSLTFYSDTSRCQWETQTSWCNFGQVFSNQMMRLLTCPLQMRKISMLQLMQFYWTKLLSNLLAFHMKVQSITMHHYGCWRSSRCGIETHLRSWRLKLVTLNLWVRSIMHPSVSMERLATFNNILTWCLGIGPGNKEYTLFLLPYFDLPQHPTLGYYC